MEVVGVTDLFKGIQFDELEYYMDTESPHIDRDNWEHRGHYYAKAQNLSRRLRLAYDKMLEDYDLLLLPTVALKARELPDANASPREIAETAFLYISNCCPFNVTGHPAMSVPCGVSEDIPIGMMLVAKHWDEAKIYSVSYAFEQAYDWKKF